MFGLKKPLPAMSRPRARCSTGGKAIAKWPSAIVMPPMRIALRRPRYLSAR